ncbi:unannotated protein [freshwater metagenome]|uniref:Unannotated protein n=1 Tax=freshwater metagenome TaxID=449393 RepID=A0A6J7QJK2_9ZZZZ
MMMMATTSISRAKRTVLSGLRVENDRPPILIDGIPATPKGPPVTVSHTVISCWPPSWKARVSRIRYSPLTSRTAGNEMISAARKVTTIAAIVAAHQGQPRPYPTPETFEL